MQTIIRKYIKNCGRIVFVLFMTGLLYPAWCFSNVAEMIWVLDDEYESHIVISTYSNGDWKNAQRIEACQTLCLLPALGSDSTGKRLAVWVEMGIDGRSSLKYSFSKNRGWATSAVLTDLFEVNLAPIIVFNHQDVPMVFWSANDGQDDDIYMAIWNRKSWESPVLINDENDKPDILPEAGLENNSIWVRWKTLDDNGEYRDAYRYIESNTQRFDAHISKENRNNSYKRKNIKDHNIEMPTFFHGKSRATIHLPDDREVQSITIEGNENVYENDIP